MENEWDYSLKRIEQALCEWAAGKISALKCICVILKELTIECILDPPSLQPLVKQIWGEMKQQAVLRRWQMKPLVRCVCHVIIPFLVRFTAKAIVKKASSILFSRFMRRRALRVFGKSLPVIKIGLLIFEIIRIPLLYLVYDWLVKQRPAEVRKKLNTKEVLDRFGLVSIAAVLGFFTEEFFTDTFLDYFIWADLFDTSTVSVLGSTVTYLVGAAMGKYSYLCTQWSVGMAASTEDKRVTILLAIAVLVLWIFTRIKNVKKSSDLQKVV